MDTQELNNLDTELVPIARFFLKIKHWQFFLLTIVTPLLLQIIFIIITIADKTLALDYFFLPILITVLYLGGAFGWMASIGLGFNKLLPDSIKQETGMYTFCLVFPFVCIFLMIATIYTIIIKLPESMSAVSNVTVLGLGIFIDLFAVFCHFYIFYFTSKIFRTIELRKQITFKDHAGEFFLVWFYIVGIWILQPRINEIYKNNFKN